MDLGTTIAPKSDQLNADDLITGPITIRVTKVAANLGSDEQPVSVFFEGDGGKPYRPCKSMRRVLVMVWGREGADYTGRSMTLYRDPKVIWGGLALGGIRISHMSHIDEPVTMMLTASKSNRKPYTVHPLVEAPKVEDKAEKGVNDLLIRIDAADTAAAYVSLTGEPAVIKQLAWLGKNRPELLKRLTEGMDAKRLSLQPLPPDTAPAENADMAHGGEDG